MMSATTYDAPAPARSLVVGALVTLYLVWGSTYYALALALRSFPPFFLGGVRFLLAGSLLFSWLRMRGVAAPRPREWLAAAPVGALLFGLGNGGLAYAQEFGVSSSVAALVAATTPLFMGGFAWLWGSPPSSREWQGLVAGLVGVTLMKAGGSLDVGGITGILLVLAPAGWALGSMLSRRLPGAGSPMVNAGQMLFGGVTMSLMSLVRGEPWPAQPTPVAWAAFAYLVTVGSLVGFVCYGFLLRHTRPAMAMSYAYVNPMVAMLLGVSFAGEVLTPLTVTGAFVILGSVALLTRGQPKRV
jgi:drug/metabolite transporter (DMT)-like permease